MLHVERSYCTEVWMTILESGWDLWVWLQCIGVASRCCYKEVYRYPHNNY